MKEKLLKHLLILIVVCLLALLGTFIMSLFTTPHPDAYKDIVRSIVMVYAICFLIETIYSSIIKRIVPKRISNSLNEFAKEGDVFATVSIIFLLLTVINSLMMLTGIDVPKDGVFAYVHMMTRLLIISLITSLIMWRSFLNAIKTFNINKIFKQFHENIHCKPISYIAKIFTIFTVAYCVFMISFQTVINPQGGSVFYIVLLLSVPIISIYVLMIKKLRKIK